MFGQFFVENAGTVQNEIVGAHKMKMQTEYLKAKIEIIETRLK